jgi:hypothetical protein
MLGRYEKRQVPPAYRVLLIITKDENVGWLRV